MSWIDKLNNVKFEIITGDGKSYFPLWKSSEKSKDYNTAKYNFINVKGSFVDRKQPQGNNFPLIFYFQGDDNIEQCDAFESSADDSRLWTIKHPFYGTIKGQPTNLKRNDANYNVTEVTVDFWESITEDYPLSNTSNEELINNKADIVNEDSIETISEKEIPEVSDISLMRELVISNYSKLKLGILKLSEYKNLYNKVLSAVDDLVGEFESFMDMLQDLLKFPFDSKDEGSTIVKKIENYKNAYSETKKILSGGNELNPVFNTTFKKSVFESVSSDILSSVCQIVVNPLNENEYITRKDVESVVLSIRELYEDYLSVLDSNQVSTGAIKKQWIPSQKIQSGLLSLLTFTSNSLFKIGYNARQERIIELEADSNVIVLTHRFLGLDQNDKNIEIFKKINNIKNDKNYRVRKGSLIKYFV